MKSIGNIFADVGVKLVVGRLVYDERHHHGMISADLAVLLPLCREKVDGELVCFCKPWPEVTEPPYLQADMQLCRTKDKREKLGWVCSCDKPNGEVTYRIAIDCQAILKRFDVVWVHLHDHNEKEDGGDE
jgi:hypothetical protein